MKKKTFLKKFLALGLCFVLSFTMLTGAALAVETFTTSDACVEMIKELEGFRETPYVGVDGEWYVGYGLACEDPAAYQNGISPEEAEMLLRTHLIQDEQWVNDFLLQYGISVNQQQFDALISLTYTLGTQWINTNYRLCSYLINGIERYSEVEVVNAIATWCHTGTTVVESLVGRRLREAFLFLYGQYENDGPEFYGYIHFEPNGGSMENRTVFYPIGGIYGDLPVPTLAGQNFLGWFTAEGVQMTGAETVGKEQTLYARWSSGGSAPAAPVTVKKDYSSWVNPYKDVKSSDWFYSYVRELSAEKVIGGYLDGTFQPNNQLTAGEALKLLLVAATQTDPGNAPVGHWAENYLVLAEALNCVAPGEIVDLDAPIDRLSIARIAAVAMGIQPMTGVTPFADLDDGYALALFEAGIFTGDTVGNQRFFNPYSGITRAEMSAIVSRIRNYAPVNNPATSGYISYGGKQIPVLWDVPVCPYNKDLFVRDGSWMYYNDPNYVTALGIDVSRHQGKIDWQKVAATGMVQFAMLRVGGRGADSGEIYDDTEFINNIVGAKAAGIKVGVYFYSTAVSAEEAVEEANYVIEKVAPYGLEYPIVFDWEIYSKTSRNASLSKDVLTASAKAFCDTVAWYGYTPMIYMGLETGYVRMDLSQLTAYDKWFAQYIDSNRPSMYYDYRMWQYSDSGRVPGIDGKVDMDIIFLPY